jgi:hypothetical protein
MSRPVDSFTTDGILPMLEDLYSLGQVHTKLLIGTMDMETEQQSFMSFEGYLYHRLVALNHAEEGLIVRINQKLASTNRRVYTSEKGLIMPISFPMPPSKNTLIPEGTVLMSNLLRMMQIAFDLGAFSVKRARLNQSVKLDVECSAGQSQDSTDALVQSAFHLSWDQGCNSCHLTSLLQASGFPDRECSVMFGKISFSKIGL